MYVLAFSMGPIGSPMPQIGVQLTDSPYAVVNMLIMARIGLAVFEEIDASAKRVVPCVHSIGGRRPRFLPGSQDDGKKSCFLRNRPRKGARLRVTLWVRAS
jgi:phosphoenolpyruvate carboxykinase (GTP)